MNIFSSVLVRANQKKIMSSNALTADQPVEVIKKFKFSTKGGKEEIEIAIPEVSTLIGSLEQFIENKYGVGNDAIV